MATTNATPPSGEPLVAVRDLRVSFRLGGEATFEAVKGVSFDIPVDSTVALVGESGSGKSVTALSILGLLPPENSIVDPRSRIVFGGRNLVGLPLRAMRDMRGADISMIFQEPMTSLNPVFTVGFQLAEVLRLHRGLSPRAAHRRAIELLDEVGIPEPRRRIRAFPSQMSGGQQQRVMIAMAIACEPKLLIADEPTTALDVTIQAQILTLIRRLRDDTGMGVLLITHDLGVVAGMADRVVVMYAGQVVEEAPVGALFARPRHPYTRMLLRAVPRVARKLARLATIAGTMPPPSRFPAGCRFHPRCPDAIERCRAEAPALVDDGSGRMARCWRADETGLASEAVA